MLAPEDVEDDLGKADAIISLAVRILDQMSPF
jgi:hypothetical protein